MDIFLVIFLGLISMTNPVGAVPIFLALTQDQSKQSIKRTIIFTSINVFMILLTSFLIGNHILNFFGISIDVLRIAGGIIIAQSGFGLLSGTLIKQRGMTKSVTTDAQERSDIALTPLSIPILAGPGAMSLLISINIEYPNLLDKGIIVVAILTLSIFIYLILSSAQLISKILGQSGIVAISRITGFLVVAIGIEFIISSLTNIFNIK